MYGQIKLGNKGDLKMSILIKPTKIKDGFYLLVPKLIAELINIKDKTEFRMEIENKDKIIINYIENKHKAKRKVVAKHKIKRAKKIKRRKK